VTAYSVATLNSDGSVLIDTLSVDAASGDTASVTVTGLTNGTSYTFKILARNADGNSDYSEISTSATPRTVADAPGIPTLVAADEQITATWTAPASNNGAEITGYTATASASGSSAGTCSTTSATDLDCAITSLTNGTSYEVTVTAANSAGNSNASAGAAATPSTTPGAPTGVAGTAGAGKVTVTWSAPTETGGSDITQYTATATPDGAFCISTSALTCDITGLTNGTEYTFRAKATNANGAGSNSSASGGVTPVSTPGTATALSGTADAASVVLSWTAPTDTGGSAITDYTVEYSSDSGTTWSTFADGTSTTASARVTGLTNGTAYVFRVTTVNAQGSGSATSASSAVTPVTTPTAATLVAGTAGDTQVALTWTAPTDNGGSAVTDYTVEYSSDSGTTWTTFTDGTSTTASATVTGLTNGTSYTFRVSPVNAQGTGTASTASAAVVPVTTPGAPTSVAATADGTSATVTWTAPSSTGGSAITGYKVEQTVDAGTTWTTATANTASTAVTATYSDLTSGASYSFRVSAINAVGTGSASTASTAVQTGPNDAEVNAWLATESATNFLAILAFAGQDAAETVAASAAETEAWLDSDDGRRFLGLPTKAEEEAATLAWLATDEATTFLAAVAAAEEAEEAAATAATQAWLATDEASRFLASLG